MPKIRMSITTTQNAQRETTSNREINCLVLAEKENVIIAND